MNLGDLDTFADLISDTYSLLGKTVPPEQQMAMFFRAMGNFPIEVIADALSAHLADPARGRFAPVPADLIEKIEKSAQSDGRPGVDAAWDIALNARSEDATVVWTEETAQAWSSCQNALEIRDTFGARRAFAETYERLVSEARAQRKPCQWIVSEGFDKAGREEAVLKAVTLGYVPPSLALSYQSSSVSIAGLLESGAKIAPEAVREQLVLLKAEIAADVEARKSAPSYDVVAKAETADAKREMAEKVASFEGESA